MGCADIDVHGVTDVLTPHIDGLARNGMRFSSGYVSGPYRSPTRAALLTGRCQQRYGHEFNSGPFAEASASFGLPVTEHTLADRLESAGYRTGMVGTWNLAFRPEFHPMKRGFDEFVAGDTGHRPTADGTAAERPDAGTQPLTAENGLT